MAKRHWREPEDLTPKSTPREQLPCLVVRATPDGYVVGRGFAVADSVEWLSPSHAREWLETRPKDITVTAEKWANEDGTVTLKPKCVNKGAPVPTQVGWHVVFGELFDSAAHRAKGELSRQMKAVLRERKSFWRHLCGKSLRDGLPLWTPTPHGEACAICGATQDGKKASAA